MDGEASRRAPSERGDRFAAPDAAPAPPAGSGGGSAAGSLAARVRAEIARRGPQPFARLMELALYDEQAGYYARGAGLGPQGDFVTASDAGPHLGRCLARHLAEVDRRLGRPQPFRLVEWGAGRGLLARDLIDAAGELVPELARRLQVVLVDRSPALRAAAARLVPEARVQPPGEPLPPGDGVVLAVELFDAVPVHRLRRRDGRLAELLVGLDAAGRLVEVEGRPAPAAAELARRYGAAAAEGSEAEVAPQADELLDRLVGCLGRGAIVVVDYGDRAERLYGPARPRGTLLAYRGHRTSERVLDDLGAQDLTAHVNFTQLADRARRRGLEVAGLTTQDRFLIGTGILETFEPPPAAQTHSPARARARMQALHLIHPEGMGRAFRVLLLQRGLAPGPPWRGLADPFAREDGRPDATQKV